MLFVLTPYFSREKSTNRNLRGNAIKAPAASREKKHKVVMPLIRVVCQNTLNLALNGAKRIWTAKHTMSGIDTLSHIRSADKKVMEFISASFVI